MSYELDVDALTEEDAKAMAAASERMARDERPSFEWSRAGGFTAFVGVGWAWSDAGLAVTDLGRGDDSDDGGVIIRVSDLASASDTAQRMARSQPWQRAISAQAGGEDAWELWKDALLSGSDAAFDPDEGALDDDPGDDEGTRREKAMLRSVVAQVMAAVAPISAAAAMERAETRGQMESVFAGRLADGLSKAAWAGDAAGVIALGHVVDAAREAGIAELRVVAG